MEGYLVIFFTQQNRTHEDVSVANWILKAARDLGVRGATLFSGKEGFGHDGRLHTDNYFDLQDPPVQVAMALTHEECDKLMAILKEGGLRVFYTKSAIEFGFVSED
ncbi:DUF190 domain-containing protein [Maridesulfovibrio sp.]|uniref:DUF190 domain-containing protein n=1 Tax=Maridesulfovibrio sp. TaxID=2795000 RepID=UPI002A186C3B|nr:DUF190 domain-containing protein [Maridesulfovibrio sp.]